MPSLPELCALPKHHDRSCNTQGNPPGSLQQGWTMAAAEAAPQLPLSGLFLNCNFTVALVQSPELNFSPFSSQAGGRGANVTDENSPYTPRSSLLFTVAGLQPRWLSVPLAVPHRLSSSAAALSASVVSPLAQSSFKAFPFETKAL